MTGITVPELRAIQSGLEQFSKHVHAQLTERSFTVVDGQQLVQAMTFVVNACHAASASPNARQFAVQHQAGVQFDVLASVCTPQQRQRFDALPRPREGWPSTQIEAAVLRRYDVARPVMQAAAQLMKKLIAAR